MSKPKRLPLKKRAMVNAMKTYFSNVSASCESVGIRRNTHYEWMEKDREYKEQIEDLRMILDDNIETKAVSKCLNGDGDTSMIQFMLKTRMKNRGYVEKTIVEQVGELKIMQETTIDFSGLSVDELRTLKAITEKAKLKK